MLVPGGRAGHLPLNPSLRMTRLLPLAFLAVTACYRYTEVSPAALQPGAEVRARVSAVGQDRVRRGPEAQARLLPGASVTGRVVRLAGDTVVLGVDRVELEANVRARTTLVDLPLLRAELQTVQLRQLNRRRTVVASTAVSIATIAALYFALDRGRGALGDDPGPPGPAESRLPAGLVIRLP